MDILNKILYLIKERGLTQQAILKEFGYDKSFFSDWKAGKIKNPPIDKIVKFAEYFNVTTDYLLGLSGQKQNEVKNEKEKKMMERLVTTEMVVKAMKDFIERLKISGMTLEDYSKRTGINLTRLITIQDPQSRRDFPTHGEVDQIINLTNGGSQNLLQLRIALLEESKILESKVQEIAEYIGVPNVQLILLVDAFRELNDKGQTRLINYAYDLKEENKVSLKEELS